MEIGTCAWCIDDTVGECGAHMYTQMLFAKTVFTRAIVCFSGLMSAIGSESVNLGEFIAFGTNDGENAVQSKRLNEQVSESVLVL